MYLFCCCGGLHRTFDADRVLTHYVYWSDYSSYKSELSGFIADKTPLENLIVILFDGRIDSVGAAGGCDLVFHQY